MVLYRKSSKGFSSVARLEATCYLNEGRCMGLPDTVWGC